MINKQIRDKIVQQALSEIAFDRKYKQGKVSNWQKNENLYYGKKEATAESRANVDLARMQEFVHTLLSKIDNPLVFKFIKRKEAQLKRVKRLNSLRESDRQKDNWDIKDLVGKKQGIIYGRSVYSYYADSIEGYQAHLDNVDVYNFLIDPSGGGVDLELARNMGRYGVIKTRQELKDGVKNGIYLKTEVQELLFGVGNNTESPQEEVNKYNRTYGQNVYDTQKNNQSDDVFKFWEWFTTFEGERYYLLLQEGGRAVRLEKLIDLFSATKTYPLGPWPFWSWAAFPDLTEFWTPSYCDYVREMFMAQNVSINQMLDNAEQINKPQKVVDVGSIENLAELKYRKDGIIKTKFQADANKVVQVLRPTSIDTPIQVFEILEGIQEKALGVTSGAKGVAEEEGKVAIYQGNQEAAADRFGLLNKSYSFGYRRFASLYELGVRDNLTKKVAINILGPDGIETEEVSKSDIFRKGDEFDVLVEASNAEDMASLITQRTKLEFLASQAQNMTINQKKSFELQAKIAGFEDEEIKELQDTDNYGNQEVMSEAERDLESLIEGEPIQPNENANTAYKQRMVDWLKDHKEDLKPEDFIRIALYIRSLDEVIMRNMARSINQFAIDQLNSPTAMPNLNPNPLQDGAMEQGVNNNPVQEIQTNETGL